MKKSREALNFDLSKEIFDQKQAFHLDFQKRFMLDANGEI